MFQRNALAGVVMTMIVGLAVSAAAQTGFSDDIADYVWDLSSLCSSDAAFEDERAQVAAELDSIGRYRGTSSDGPAALAAALDAVSDLRGRAGKLYLYAALTAEIDITDERAQQRLDAASALEAQMTAAISFLRSEVLALGAETVGRWIDEHPAVARHKIRLLRILREGPYTRGPEAQEIIDGLERWPRMMIDFFDMINESGYCWPQVRNSDGETVTIDRVTFRRLRRETDTAFRDRAVSAYLQSLAGLEKFFGAVYTKRCEADLAIAQARNFASGIDAIWFLREQMPPGSHRTVIDVAHENIPLLRRYVRLRNRALGIAEPTYMDLYRQPANPGAEFPINRALQISCAALSVFGSEYQERLRGRIADGQLHLPPMENKRPTYGIFPAVAGAKSYFLFSYQPTYRHARALAGGLLLLMAFSDIPSDLEPDSRDDPGIYSNGLIYVGDMLFDDQLLRETTATPERVALLLNALELLWNNFFEWAIMAELDTRVEALIAEGQTPGGREISTMYLELLHKYWGEDGEIISIPTETARLWMTSPTPFYSYESQFWPPAIAAAAAVAERITAGDQSALSVVQGALGRGDSDRSYALFKQHGIDLTTTETYQALMRRMSELLDQLESALE